MLLHFVHHSELLLCVPFFAYFRTGSLTRPRAKTDGFKIWVVEPKSNASAILVQPLQIVQNIVEDVFVSFPNEEKLRHDISSGELCHVKATPGV